MNWTNLSITVTNSLRPVQDLVVTFVLLNSSKRISFTITAMTNSNGVATITNSSTNSYVKTDKSTQNKTTTNSGDFDFENLSSWYVSYEFNGVVTNSPSQTLVSGNNTGQSSPRSTNYNTYTTLKITTSMGGTKVRCFCYNSNGEYMGRLSVITSQNDSIGTIDLVDSLDDYTTLNYIQFNAYRDYSSYGNYNCMIYCDTDMNDINTASMFTYDGDKLCATINLSLHYGWAFSARIGTFIACDYLAKHTGNINPIYANTNLVIKNASFDSNVWTGNTIWGSYEINGDFIVSGYNLTFEAHPQQYYNSGATEGDVDIFDYPYNYRKGFLVDEVCVECLKTEYQVRLPRILDTAKIRDTIQYNTPIYNLKDTSILFTCPIKSGVYTASVSSNDSVIVFNSSTIGSDYLDVIRAISLVDRPNSLSVVPTFTLSKHHYLNNRYYAIAGSESFFVVEDYQHHADCEYFFVDYQLSDNVPATAYTATSLYNGERGTNRGGGDERNSSIRYVDWSDYSDSPILPLPYEMIYMTIKREKYVCPREKELDDYINGFSYNENSLPYSALANFNLTANTEFSDRKKLYVAKESFLNACGNKVAGGDMPTVPVYKEKFVEPYLNKGTRYGTDYTKRNLYDSYFLTDSDSGHAYVFDTKKYTFYPKTDYPYLRFEKLETTGTETVTLNKYGNPTNVTLLYSTSENLWFDYTIGTPITIPTGGYVEFRNKYDVSTFSKNGSNYYHFLLQGGVDTRVLGNISSLLNSSAIGITVTAATSYLFLNLFNRELDLVDAGDLYLDVNKVPYYGYAHMFRECSNLISGPEITAYSGSDYCFAHMFHDCISMETGPSNIFGSTDTGRTIEYPDYCCAEMFNNCTNLRNGPYLEKSVTCRTAFGVSCFGNMFLDCTSMRCLGNENEDTYIGGTYYDSYTSNGQISVDNSSILSEQSCYGMFAGCTSLIKSPIFNPCYIDDHSCFGMFSGCSHLVKTYMNIDSYYTYDGEIEQNPGYVGPCGCAFAYINCSSLKELGRIKLKATVLSEKSYFYMFSNCTNIGGFTGGNESYTGDDDKKLPKIEATYIPSSACAYMYYMCFGNSQNPNYLNQFINEDFSDVDNFGMAHMFDSCEYLDTYPKERELKYLGHTVSIKSNSAQCTAQGHAYIDTDNNNMLKILSFFVGDVPQFQNGAIYTDYDNTEVPTDSSGNALASYFDIKTSNLTISYKTYYIVLNAGVKENTHISDSCYAYMFNECNHLHYANHILLPRQVLAPYCYDHMFYNCDSLFAIPVLSAVTTVDTCSMSYMFAECSSVVPNNRLGWWQEVGWHRYTFYNHYNRLMRDSNENDDERPYYVCRKGLYSIQKDYFYTYEKNGRFKWKGTYGGLYGNYLTFNASGEPRNNSSVAWLLTYTSTGNAMQSKTWEFGGDSRVVNFVGESGMTNMFENCHGLTYAYFKVVSSNQALPEYTFNKMFKNDFSLRMGVRVGFDAATGVSVTAKQNSFSYMFENCFEAKESFLENRNCSTLGHALRPNSLGHAAFADMYHNCYKLKFAPRVIATSLSESCCAHMFDGCWRLIGMGTSGGTGVNDPRNASLPATTLATNCYASMFYDCHSLMYAPALCASTLVTNCYGYMFSNASKRYFNGHYKYKIYAEIRAASPSNPFYIDGQIDERTYWSISTKQDDDTHIRGKSVYIKFMGDEFYYFVETNDESSEFISCPKILNLSDDFLNVVYLDASLFSKNEPPKVTNWTYGNSELYFYDNHLPHTGYIVYDADEQVVGVYNNMDQAESILQWYPDGKIVAESPYPVFYNNKSGKTFNYKPSMGFYGVHDFVENMLSSVLGNGTRHLHSKHFVTHFQTNTYTFSGESDDLLYSIVEKDNNAIYFYGNYYSSWEDMYNHHVIGGADKFAIWVADDEDPPSNYKKYNGNDNIYVPKSMKRYEIRQQYEITSHTVTEDVYEENIDLNASGQNWKKDKFFKSPTDIRISDDGIEMFSNFNVPLDNLFDSGDVMSLSSITISAKTLNATYSEGWVQGLKFINGHFYAKSGGNIPNNENGRPQNWTSHLS